VHKCFVVDTKSEIDFVESRPTPRPVTRGTAKGAKPPIIFSPPWINVLDIV